MCGFNLHCNISVKSKPLTHQNMRIWSSTHYIKSTSILIKCWDVVQYRCTKQSIVWVITDTTLLTATSKHESQKSTCILPAWEITHKIKILPKCSKLLKNYQIWKLKLNYKIKFFCFYFDIDNILRSLIVPDKFRLPCGLEEAIYSFHIFNFFSVQCYLLPCSW